MGRLAAEDMLAHSNRRNALLWHLQVNHYPPVPESMVDPCETAIEYANDGQWDAMIGLPEGVTYRGDHTAPVRAIIEQHHLDVFLDPNEEE